MLEKYYEEAAQKRMLDKAIQSCFDTWNGRPTLQSVETPEEYARRWMKAFWSDIAPEEVEASIKRVRG